MEMVCARVPIGNVGLEKGEGEGREPAEYRDWSTIQYDQWSYQRLIGYERSESILDYKFSEIRVQIYRQNQPKQYTHKKKYRY